MNIPYILKTIETCHFLIIRNIYVVSRLVPLFYPFETNGEVCALSISFKNQKINFSSNNT